MSTKTTISNHQDHCFPRRLKVDDYTNVKEVFLQAYPGFTTWSVDQFTNLVSMFPAGQIGIENNNTLVGVALSIIVNHEKQGDFVTFAEATADGAFSTHRPEGDTLYGIDIYIHPAYRNMGLGRQLYDEWKKICRDCNLKAIVGGGRIPGYTAYKKTLTTDEYVEKVCSGELYDPVLTFQLTNGFSVKKIIQGYQPGDFYSADCATLVEWLNTSYSAR